MDKGPIVFVWQCGPWTGDHGGQLHLSHPQGVVVVDCDHGDLRMLEVDDLESELGRWKTRVVSS